MTIVKIAILCTKKKLKKTESGLRCPFSIWPCQPPSGILTWVSGLSFSFSKGRKGLILKLPSIESLRFWLVVLWCIGENPFSVGLVDLLFQSASNQVEMVEKAHASLSRVTVARLRTIPRSYRVSTEQGWKSVLSRNVHRINPNRLRLKRLIPVEYDLSYVVCISSLSRLVLFACLLYQVPVLFCFAVWWVFSWGSGSADVACNTVAMDFRLSRRCRTLQCAKPKWFWPAVTASTAEHLNNRSQNCALSDCK